MKRYADQGGLDLTWIERYCRGDWKRCVRYRMEEQGRYHPDSMLPDGTVDPSLRQPYRAATAAMGSTSITKEAAPSSGTTASSISPYQSDMFSSPEPS